MSSAAVVETVGSFSGSTLLALVYAYRSGLLARRHWVRNIVAGLIVGVGARPLAMALAIASAGKPAPALYAASSAGIRVSL